MCTLICVIYASVIKGRKRKELEGARVYLFSCNKKSYGGRHSVLSQDTTAFGTFLDFLVALWLLQLQPAYLFQAERRRKEQTGYVCGGVGGYFRKEKLFQNIPANFCRAFISWPSHMVKSSCEGRWETYFSLDSFLPWERNDLSKKGQMAYSTVSSTCHTTNVWFY